MEQQNDRFANIRDEQYQPSIAESNVRSVVSHSSFDVLYLQFKEYHPRSPTLDIQKLRASQHLKLKKFKESAYFGEIFNGKRHGQGIMLYNNERIYEGSWVNDYKQGPGYELFANGSVYQGMYVNGKPEGVGKYVWPNGQFYEGEWINGSKHGSGMWQGPRGDSYLGEWRMGNPEGYGVHVWINGDRYEGEFKQFLKHGQGTQKFANGDLYKGEYSKGKPNGYGEYYWQNGCYYKGHFKNGLREGHGMWKQGPGASNKYEGEFSADKKNGYGIYTWASGDIYKGHFQQDIRDGYGEMYWVDGSYYKGLWQKGEKSGEGLLYKPKQGTKKGKFKNNVLVELQGQEPPTSNTPVIQNPSKTGVLHKKHISNVPLDAKQNYKSMQKKKRLISLYQNSDKKPKRIKVNKQLHPFIYKGDIKSNPKSFTVDLQRAAKNGAYMKTKQRIPHSAFYMHKLYKRVHTATNEYQSGEENRNNGQVLDELRNFKTRLAGRKPY